MRLRFRFGAALAALAMTICGCNGLVVDALESGGQNVGGEDDTNTGEDPGVVKEPGAIAMTVAQWLSVQHPYKFFGSLMTDGADPDDLVLVITSEAGTCADPVIDFSPGTSPAECADQAFWQYALVIPADRVHPGIIDLSDTDIDEYMAVWHADCGGGHGSGPGIIPGTLEIVSVDAGSLSVTLDIDPQDDWGDPNGDWVAPLCP